MRYAIGLLLLFVTTSANAEVIDYGFVSGNCQNGMCQRPLASKAVNVIKAPIVVAEKIVKAPFIIADRIIDRRYDDCDLVEHQYNDAPQCYGYKRCRRGLILGRWRR